VAQGSWVPLAGHGGPLQSASMADGSSHIEPVSADDVLQAQFTLIKKAGYDTHEVDSFLDRIAATLDTDLSIGGDGSLTPEDVRTVSFKHMRRGGYDPQQVDTFLDRVVAVFTTRIGEAMIAPPAVVEPIKTIDDDLLVDLDPDPIETVTPLAEVEPEPVVDPVQVVADLVPVVPEPEQEPEPVAVAPEPVVSAPTPSPGGGHTLHDPEGAAQRLLAAAQLAADSLAADAGTYALGVRSEADAYAATARTEADEYSAAVTAAAEAQASAIREVAADEARRVAEEARTGVINEIGELEVQKRSLEAQKSLLETEVDAERARILTIIDDLRAAVSADGDPPQPPPPPPPSAAAAAAVPDVASEVEVAGEVEEAFAETPVEAAPTASDADVNAAAEEGDVADDDNDDGSLAPVIKLGEAGSSLGDEVDVTGAVARSVFDTDPGDGGDDTSADWLDDAPEAAQATASQPQGAIFDIEAEAGDATQAIPAVDAGDRFFDELREAETDDGLGPLDEDTDAALSAFFDDDNGTTDEGRWGSRFGPGKD
jgi:DivIVA domain-containing protein